MELSFFVLFFSLLMGGITGTLASQNNRNFRFWFYLGVLFPLITLLVLLLLPPKAPETLEKQVDQDTGNHQPEITQPTPEKQSTSQRSLYGNFWYYLESDDQKKGPFVLDSMKSLLKKGALTGKNYVWSPGMKKWEKIDNLSIFS